MKTFSRIKKPMLHLIMVILLDICLSSTVFLNLQASEKTDTITESNTATEISANNKIEEPSGLKKFFSNLFSRQSSYSQSVDTSSNIEEKAEALTNKVSGLRGDVAKLALQAQTCFTEGKNLKNSNILTIIDYSLPATQQRMWIFDLKKNKPLYSALVAHGKNSGQIKATQFSDNPGSLQSSIGLFTTGGTYNGSHGESLELIGHEPGFNAHALSRRIVIHGATYVSEQFVKQYGYLGRSWGCPALATNIIAPVIKTIKNGSLVFAYYPDHSWLNKSKFLNCSKPKN